MSEFLRWIFNRGNEKSYRKTTAGSMLQVATIFGKQNDLYSSEKFWQDAIESSGGNRIFSDAQIPEDWQVRQFIQQMSTAVKQNQKAKAGVQQLSPDARNHHLLGHLKDIEGLPGDLNTLGDLILGLGVDLSVLKQMDLNKVVDKVIYQQVHRRAIIEACKLVGRQPPRSMMIPVTQEADVEEQEDGTDVIQQLQDIYDAENNNNDEDPQYGISNHDDVNI